MKNPQILALAKGSVVHIANVVRLFFCDPPQSKNRTYLSPFDSAPVPMIDKGLQYERYSEAVRRLRPLFPLTCTFLEPDDVKMVGGIPIGAGGSADIWEGTIAGTSIFQKSYRCYESCDVEHILHRYLREVWIRTDLSHQNIVPFVGINPTPNHPFALLLDTAGHLGLKEYLHKNPTTNRLELSLGIARGLKHMHDQGIIHGHLAPQNILVSSDGTPRITGFGSSLMISRPDLWPERYDPYRGSAPELVCPHKLGKHAARITKASDVYAFGMLTWEIFSGECPFSGDLDNTVICRVLKGDRPSRPDHTGLSNGVWKMIRKCWHDTPPRRLRIWEAVALIEAELLGPFPGARRRS